MKKAVLKQFIKYILKEVSQKDINMRHPRRSGFDNDWNPKLEMMTLDNLKSIMAKTKSTIKYIQSNPHLRTRSEDLQRELKLYKLYSDEIKKRLQYINKPIGESTEPSIGGSYSDQAMVTEPDDITQLERDPLTDPMLNQKLHEAQYRFDDFNWMKRGDGFGIPTDVYYGTILLGVVVSQPNGYLVALVKGPTGDRSYKQDPKRPFKTKDDAAEALHRAWKSLRQGKETETR